MEREPATGAARRLVGPAPSRELNLRGNARPFEGGYAEEGAKPVPFAVRGQPGAIGSVAQRGPEAPPQVIRTPWKYLNLRVFPAAKCPWNAAIEAAGNHTDRPPTQAANPKTQG
jgi:hypothetical protein